MIREPPRHKLSRKNNIANLGLNIISGANAGPNAGK
jgi:hypothetical protein